MRRYSWLAALIAPILLASAALYAQTTQDIAPTQKLNWKQIATTLAEANSFQYSYKLDGSTTPKVFTATCTGTASPFDCTATIDAQTMAGTAAGTHTVTIASAVVLNGGVTLPSGDSAVCSFRFRTPPAVPTNLIFI